MTGAEEFYRHFEEEINKLWLFKLYGEFEEQNKLIHKTLGFELKRPNLAISRDSSIWGIWDSDNRTITLNLDLLRNFCWDATIYTLKHEIAHMIVNEIYKPAGMDASGKHHGELFKKACRILSLPDTNPFLTHSLPQSKEKMIERIRKLLALGESPNPKEAENALSKAHELMVRYNVSSMDIPNHERTFTARPIGREWKKVPTYIKTLGALIHNYYFVNYIFCFAENGRYIELFGEPKNLDIAEYVFHFLLYEGEVQWEKFRKNKKKEKTCIRYSKTAFIDGLYEGFASTLKRRDQEIMKKIDPMNTLPIGLKDPLLNEKYRVNYPHLRKWYSSSGNNPFGRHEGKSIGETIRIRQGIHKGTGKTRYLKH